ncbi:hypothetical protein [Streptomyces goshikiensis]|uniref:hypothetical protein n=1 Tax=Streptomyces goshikiensis TaxID=1942 RepID=UPI003655D7AD
MPAAELPPFELLPHEDGVFLPGPSSLLPGPTWRGRAWNGWEPPYVNATPYLDRKSVTGTSPYQDWRSPLVGWALLVPVVGGCGDILVADVSGQGVLVLPVGSVDDNQPAPDIAGILTGVRVYTLLVEDTTQMRRRKVTTRVLATLPVQRDEVPALTYRDPRAVLRILPADEVLARMPELARPRLALALQSLATGDPTYIFNGSAFSLSGWR